MNRAKQILEIFQLNRIFYLCCLVFFCAGTFFLLLFSKADSFSILNGFHCHYFDLFFEKLTFFGDGIFVGCLCVLAFIAKQRKLAFYILIAYASSGIFSQVIKHLMHTPRPKIYFETSKYLLSLYHEGKRSHGSNSFPSGHSTSAFALATVLANYYKKNAICILFFTAALLICYSRIYLAEHFPVDVFAGAIIGITFGTLTCSFLTLPTRKKNTRFRFNSLKKWHQDFAEHAL